MTLYLKGHQKYDRSKLKVQLLLSKFRLFNFDLSYLLYPLRYKVTQYLIRKLSDMVKMGIEGLAVAALLISVKASQKLKIYYINRALSKLNCYALYIAKLPLGIKNRILFLMLESSEFYLIHYRIS